jgi:hypothetical protein
MLSISTIERNDCVYSGAAFYDGRAGYLYLMRTATIDIPQTSSQADAFPRDDLSVTLLSTAELAECTCPEPCERDHDRD